MSRPLLSILTAACWERADKVRILRDELKSQIDQCPPGTVEHLILLDNRTRSVGLKRQALLDSALGDYVAFVDDDDWIAQDYVFALLAGIESGADVITFEQQVHVNDHCNKVIMHLGAEDEVWKPGVAVTHRNAWQVCAWKRTIAQRGLFPDIMDGEDLAWLRQIRPFAKTEHHIPAILHTYCFNSAQTLATGKTAPGS
jgi:glycosyltransferase involved in cell wall biosynthesis